MSVTKASIPLVQAIRRIGTTEVRKNVPSPVSAKLRAKQEKFQVADGTPVHLKGGMLDTIMFQGTMGLCLIGIGLSLKVFYDLGVPKK